MMYSVNCIYEYQQLREPELKWQTEFFLNWMQFNLTFIHQTLFVLCVHRTAHEFDNTRLLKILPIFFSAVLHVWKSMKPDGPDPVYCLSKSLTHNVYIDPFFPLLTTSGVGGFEFMLSMEKLDNVIESQGFYPR